MSSEYVSVRRLIEEADELSLSKLRGQCVCCVGFNVSGSWNDTIIL